MPVQAHPAESLPTSALLATSSMAPDSATASPGIPAASAGASGYPHTGKEQVPVGQQIGLENNFRFAIGQRRDLRGDHRAVISRSADPPGNTDLSSTMPAGAPRPRQPHRLGSQDRQPFYTPEAPCRAFMRFRQVAGWPAGWPRRMHPRRRRACRGRQPGCFAKQQRPDVFKAGGMLFRHQRRQL